MLVCPSCGQEAQSGKFCAKCGAPMVQNENAPVTQSTVEEKTATPATPVSTISPDQLPAELKMLTLNINVDAPDYESLLRFILEVESLERVVRVDTISYTLPTEQDRLSADFSELVNATIQVTTFYYEGEQ